MERTMYDRAGGSCHLSLVAMMSGLLCAGATTTLAQKGPPDFAANNAGWIAMGTEWTALPGSPPPVKQDPAYRYVPNNTGAQPTFRMADINNPNLTEFAKASLK